mgnify:CR=1 FL=1
MTALAVLLILIADPPQISSYVYGTHQPGLAVVLSDSAVAYAAPDTLARKLDLYHTGDTLLIEEATDRRHLRNGLRTPWYTISRPTDAEDAPDAYIPGIDLAAATIAIDSSTSLLFGVIGYDPESRRFPAEARVTSADSLLGHTPMDAMATMMEDRYDYTVTLSREDPSGLDGVEWLGSVDFSYEACGMENGSAYLAWTGDDLTAGPVSIWISEAGLFDYSERAVLPSDPGGRPDEIRIIATAENYESQTTETDTTTYIWSGHNFSQE